MKVINYSILAEDEANRLFIEAFTNQIIADLQLKNIELKYDSDFANITGRNDNDYVRNHFIQSVQIGIARFDLDLIFVALDLDINFGKLPINTSVDSTYLELAHQKVFDEMMETATIHNLEQNVLISIAVQCIEYWLYLLKINQETIQNYQQPVELIDRKDIKRLVYDNKKRKKKTRPITNKLVTPIDLKFLKANSKSFEHFYNQVRDYFDE